MTSILATVYDQLEAMTVTYVDKAGNSKTPTVYSQETMLDDVQTAHLPARILIPPTGAISINPGGIDNAEHKISDLFLLEPIAQGTGSKDEAPSLTRYIVAYAQAVGQLWQIASGANVEIGTLTANYTSGKFEFPSQSGVWFYGVRFDLTISELF